MTTATTGLVMSATKEDLGAGLVRVLRALRRVGDNRERRTELYRTIANASVDLREHFLTPEGNPDWAGRTWAYREYVRERYSEAGYSREEARPVQTSVRYHVSVRVRERLTPEEVEDLGLRAENITERMCDHRAAKSALFESLTPSADDNPDVGRAIAGAYVVLQRLSTADVGALRGQARENARAVLARLRERAEELYAATEPAG
ncbi:hypothetical protein ACFWDN_21270 [Micromonospora chalcea]